MIMRLPIFLIVVFAINGCASKAKKTPAPTVTKNEMIGAEYITLTFERGKATLTPINKRELNELAQKATRDGRAIEEIRVLAWSDKEYPQSAKRSTPKDVILAKERGQAIKEYIKEDLHAQEQVEAYNMARRPNAASRAMKGDDWTVKEAFNDNDATASRLPDGQVSYTKASKALVIIDYVDNEKQ